MQCSNFRDQDTGPSLGSPTPQAPLIGHMGQVDSPDSVLVSRILTLLGSSCGEGDCFAFASSWPCGEVLTDGETEARGNCHLPKAGG